MKWLSLSRFREMTGLSDAVLMRLLVHRRLPLRLDEGGGIEVDIEEFRTETALEALREEAARALDDENSFLAARLSALLDRRIEELFREAVALFLAEMRERER